MKSLLTPDKVGPREASGSVRPPSQGWYRQGPLSGSPAAGLQSVRWCPTETGAPWPDNNTVTCMTKGLGSCLGSFLSETSC